MVRLYDKLIFVDSDDTTRAPMAATIMKKQYLLAELKILSRGLVVLFPEPVNQKAEAILASRGLTARDHTARQLEKEDVSERTLVLTMEETQKKKTLTICPDSGQIYTIAEYIGLQGDLPPLYGKPLSEYGKCCEIIEALINGLVTKMNNEELNK